LNTNLFFGNFVDPSTLSAQALTLLIAVLLGGFIGLEREWHGNPAGMRTHILVCVGSAVITMTSVEIGLGVRGGLRGDPGHIAAQIVSGVGFLGAGAILREGATVRGLTSAASIWATAGIGIALGASPHLGELAVLATGVVLVTLGLLEPLEKRLKLKQGEQTLEVEVTEGDLGPAGVLRLLAEQGISVVGFQAPVSPPGSAGATGIRRLEIRVKLPAGFDRNALSQRLLGEAGITGFRIV
jgi:putative Mg2+ transporter-C (MgtC) family protein